MLAANALIAGDQAAAAQYMHEVSKLQPDNARYTFQYATLEEPSKREAAEQDIIRRFPNTETAADAVFMLSEDAADEGQRWLG